MVEFDHFKMEAGLPTFVLSPKQWAEKTGAILIPEKLYKLKKPYLESGIAFLIKFNEKLKIVFSQVLQQTWMNRFPSQLFPCFIYLYGTFERDKITHPTVVFFCFFG